MSDAPFAAWGPCFLEGSPLTLNPQTPSNTLNIEPSNTLPILIRILLPTSSPPSSSSSSPHSSPHFSPYSLLARPSSRPLGSSCPHLKQVFLIHSPRRTHTHTGTHTHSHTGTHRHTHTLTLTRSLKRTFALTRAHTHTPYCNTRYLDCENSSASS